VNTALSLTKVRLLSFVLGAIALITVSALTVSGSQASALAKTGSQPTATASTATPAASGGKSSQQAPAAANDSCGLNSNYVVTASAPTSRITGATKVGSGCDECTHTIALPFPFRLYDQTFTSAIAGSNGTLGFPSNPNTVDFTCMPEAGYSYTIFPYMDNMSTSGTSRGVYTMVTGVSPNRIFVIEWRTCVMIDVDLPCSGTYIFQVQLFEGQNKFDIVYDQMGLGNAPVIGVQKDSTLFTGYACGETNVSNGTRLSFSQPSCPTNTPTRTATNTPTSTPTRTSTSTPSSTPTGPTATPTNTPTPPANDVIISEFRLRGPNGANDEFVELYNNTDRDLTVNATDGSAGWAVVASDGVTRFVVPNGIVMPAHGHFLGVNSVGYSLAGYPAGNGTTATGDATYSTDIPDNAGIALFRTSNPANFAPWNRLDAVGSSSEANTLYKEGLGYFSLIPYSINYSFYRDTRGSNNPKDTNNNGADFIFVDTQGVRAGDTQRLGAPGPENLSSTVNGSLPGGPDANGIPNFTVSLLDPGVPANAAPNFVRDTTSDTANNSHLGTITVRRKITNNTGTNVTRLRFRITDITTFPEPSIITTSADLRARTSNAVVVSTSGSGNVTVQGTTLEEATVAEAKQPNGGAYNSTLSVGSVTLATPLPPGQSINVQFLFGVQNNGCFRLVFDIPGLNYAGTTDSEVCSGTSPTATSTATATRTSTATSTSTATNVPASTNTATRTPTNTTISTSTATNVPASTNTATHTATRTATSTSTATNTPGAPGASPTSTTQVPPTSTAMPPTAVPPTATRTATQQAATATASATQPGPVPPSATRTTQAVATATGVPSTCSVQFSDVAAGSAFYSYVRCLTCQTVMGGYPCGGANEPCTSPDAIYFRPSALITRGQIAKIVSNAAGFNDTVPTGQQTFEDVAPSSAFWTYIERLTSRGIMSGYNCGGPGEPCGQGSRSYFRPGANATRGQLAKIVANAAGFTDTHSNQMFNDVPASAPFFTWIERLAARGYISGYPCGGPGEPCDTANTPYFRANDNVTRGQASKIVSNTFFPNCQTP
jgi:hypothetical protein